MSLDDENGKKVPDIYDLSPEYVFNACQVRVKLMSLLDNILYFCVTADRNFLSRQLTECVNSFMDAHKLLKIQHKHKNAIINRTLAIGIFGGLTGVKENFSNWVNA